MDKKIIHQKYDRYKIPTYQIKEIHDHVKKSLPEDYILITTPTDLTCINDEDIIITIDAKAYSTKELMEIIEKAKSHDEFNAMCDDYDNNYLKSVEEITK